MIATEVDGKGPNTVGWCFVFTLDNKKYALHVNKTDNTVTAMEVSYEFDCVP